MEGDVIPLQYIYNIVLWDFDVLELVKLALDNANSEGWELITIHNNLAYFRRINPDYLKYLEIENRRRMSKRVRQNNGH